MSNVENLLTRFRCEHPRWCLETEPLQVDTQSGDYVFGAIIRDDSERTLIKVYAYRHGTGADILTKAQMAAAGLALTILFGASPREERPAPVDGDDAGEAPVDGGPAATTPAAAAAAYRANAAPEVADPTAAVPLGACPDGPPSPEDARNAQDASVAILKSMDVSVKKEWAGYFQREWGVSKIADMTPEQNCKMYELFAGALAEAGGSYDDARPPQANP